MNFQAEVICCRCLDHIPFGEDKLASFDNCIQESQQRFTFVWCGDCDIILSYMIEYSDFGLTWRFRELAH